MTGSCHSVTNTLFKSMQILEACSESNGKKLFGMSEIVTMVQAAYDEHGGIQEPLKSVKSEPNKKRIRVRPNKKEVTKNKKPQKRTIKSEAGTKDGESEKEEGIFILPDLPPGHLRRSSRVSRKPARRYLDDQDSD